jgi:hypothetical protein
VLWLSISLLQTQLHRLKVSVAPPEQKERRRVKSTVSSDAKPRKSPLRADTMPHLARDVLGD